MTGFSRWLEKKELIKRIRAVDTGWRKSCLDVYTGAMTINSFIRRTIRDKERGTREEDPAEETSEQ
jgi:hypothetical protein